MAIKILSMDDELDMEMLIQIRFRKQIQEKKFEFVFAHNGIEALEVLNNHKDIEIVLADINMPEMDGLTFLSKLDKNETARLKAIMVSAHGDMDNIRKIIIVFTSFIFSEMFRIKYTNAVIVAPIAMT